MQLKVETANRLNGEIKVPGDKSISHRALMFGALADGVTEIENFLMGQDCLSTLHCFQALGIESEIKDNLILIKGNGLHGLKLPSETLDVGNSGTTIRLMMGIMAGQPMSVTFTGDESICRRPMGRVAEPLRQMGAKITGTDNGNRAPLTVEGGNLKGITYNSPVASAQVKSAVLLAGLFADNPTTVIEPQKSRDHSERMLKFFGANIQVSDKTVTINPEPKLVAKKVIVPGDISSAAFFLVAGLIVPGSELLIKDVGVNPTRSGIIDVLQAMGGDISLENQKEVSGEPIANIRVKSSQLHGISIGGSVIPRLIDEIPVLAVAAALAEGDTTINDAAELKVKETNRIATIIGELGKFGVPLLELDDGIKITGGNLIKGAACESHNDHRIAMAMAIAGLVAQGETVINNPHCIDISFPGFAQLLQKIRC